MAGLHPKPHKNWPIPIVIDEPAIEIQSIPMISNPQEVRIASNLPKLSET